MKQKYYTFAAGDKVPEWLFSYKSTTRESLINNKHHGKIKFGVSCVVIRTWCFQSAIMQCRKLNSENKLIVISGLSDAIIGGVNGASGIFCASDDMKLCLDSYYKEYINS